MQAVASLFQPRLADAVDVGIKGGFVRHRGLAEQREGWLGISAGAATLVGLSTVVLTGSATATPAGLCTAASVGLSAVTPLGSSIEASASISTGVVA